MQKGIKGVKPASLIFMVKLVLIGLIFFIYCFFRFYNLEKRISFGWDQEQPAIQIKNMVATGKPILLGLRTVNDKGFFLTPYYTYSLVPFYLVSNLHPKALFPYVITYGLVFFFTAFIILRRVFGFWSAAAFLSFWAINPLQAKYDMLSWNPIFIPIGIIFVWHALFNLHRENGRLKNWFWLGLTLGIFMSSHVQFILIIIFSLIFIILDRQAIKINMRKTLTFGLTFFLTFIPLVIFDLRHNFLNADLLIKFLTEKTRNINGNYLAWLPVFNNSIQPVIYFKNNFSSLIFYFFILFSILWLYKKNVGFLKSFYLTSTVLWLLFPLFFAKYGQRPSEYYFIFLYPYIYIIITGFIFYLKKNYWLLFFISLLFCFNLPVLRFNLNDDFFGLFYRDKLIKKLASYTANKKFNISYTVPLGRDTGFRYLVDYYQIKQTGNWNDPLIQIKIPANKECFFKSGDIGVIIPPELR